MKKISYIVLCLLTLVKVSGAQTTWGLNNSRTDNRSDAGLQGNAGAISGFYQTDQPVNFPSGATSWWHLLDVRHNNPDNNFAMQFAGSFFDQGLYFRKTNNNPAQGWSKVLLETDGRVGIGTTSPYKPLTVVSSGIHDTGNAYYLSWFVRPTAQQWGIVVGYDNDGYGTIQSTGANSGVQLKYNYAGENYTGLTLSSQGAVGIGTASPDPAYKLSVNGNIRGKEVRVETGWSDYVFKKDYRLMTLPEVADYIAKQGHLPGVPSDAEVRKNGVNVGETESLLLKKIEELTLYLIEKDKQLRGQSLKNAEMELRLSKLEALLAKPSTKNLA